MNPSLRGTVGLLNYFRTAVSVQVDAQPAGGNQLMTVLSEKLDLNMLSCGGLPPVVNGVYAPGCVQKVSLDYKEARAIIIVSLYLPFSDSYKLL